MTLPVPPDCAPRPPGNDRVAQPRIQLLDDDPFMLSSQSRMLEGMGYGMIGVADSAETLLAMLAKDPCAVDVIVCDLLMPGMDGVTFLQRLSGTSYRGSVILLSAVGLRIMHTVQRLLDGGGLTILGALEKPPGAEAMKALLDRWMPVVDMAPNRPVLEVTSAELHAANREKQWVLHYQPKVKLVTGRLSGMEALVRWNHPRHGLLYPDTFIGLAEDTGAIRGLTQWVLAEAMEQLARWRKTRHGIQMAVNVSMEDLREPDFSGKVIALMQEHGCAPQDLILEITESRLMSPTPTPLETLVRLRMERIGLSIDDFGTGHSSLVQLRDIPFNELKIDRSFVSSARHNQVVRPILEGSIGIASRMGMRSVAEGVETEDEWHLMREIGCDLAQGWFIGRPMPASKVPAWMELWRARRAGLIKTPYLSPPNTRLDAA